MLLHWDIPANIPASIYRYLNTHFDQLFDVVCLRFALR